MGNDITNRTQAEEELRKALQAAQARNAQYEQAVSMISDIVWRYDVNTKGEHVGSYISPVADRMLGLPVGTIGDSFEKYFSYVHPDDLPAVQKVLAEWIRTFGKDKTAEYRMLKADGTMFWVRSRGSAYGRFSVYGTTSDITERKQAEEALRESEERFRTIFENNSAAMAIIERDTTISKVNREFCRLGLFEEKDLVGISWASHIHPEDLGRLLEYNQKRLIDPKSAPEKYEFKFYRKDGKIRHCLMSVAMIPTSQQIVCSFADITDRKRAEEALRQEKELAHLYLDIVGTIIIAISSDHTVSLVNQAGCRLLGYREDEIIGTNWFSRFLPAQARADVEEIFDHLMTGIIEPVRYVEGTILTRNGEERIVSWHNTILRDEAGNITGTLSSGEDITDHKKAEEELRWNAALLAAQVESTLDGILVVDSQGQRILTNQRLLTIFEVPPAISEQKDDDALLSHVAGKAKNPKKFLEKVRHLYNHPGETNRDEIVFKNGMVLDRYSSPVIDPDGKYYGRIWTFRDITEQKKAEEALRESERRLAHIIDFLPDATFAINCDGAVIAWNRAIEEMTGASKKEILGKKGFAHAVPFYRVARPILIDLIFRDQKDIENEYDFVLRKGDQLTAEVFVPLLRKGKGAYLWGIAAPLYDSCGNVVGAIESIRDITESKRAKEELQSSLRFLEILINTIPSPIFYKDRQGRYIGCNESFARQIIGISKESIMGKSVYDLGDVIPADLADKYSEMDERLLQDRSVQVYETPVQCADGVRRDFLFTKAPFNNFAGDVAGIVGVMLDITERKRADEVLRESEARYKRIVETANEGIMIMDDQFRYAFVNQKLSDMLGYQPEEMLGQPVSTFIFEEDFPDHKAMMEMRVSGAGAQYECRHRRKDGSCCYTIVSATPLKDEAGQFAGSFAMLTDISDRKHAEQELQQTNQNLKIAIEKSNELAEQARKANAAKSQFLANMSHEIRTPLNGVIGMIGLLQDTDLNAEQHEYAQIAHKSGETLLSLINDILDFSKIEACKLKLEKLNFDLHSTLKDIADLLALGAHEKRLELLCLVEPNVPSLLCGDPGRLRQILVNLGTNAVKFTDKGEIVIRVRLESEDERNVTIRFSVSDTGIGIPANRQDILFSPFTQVDGSTTRQYGGTGLGLAISKQLARLMGGKIGLESEVGKGSTFWFTAVFEKQPAGSGAADDGLAKIECEGAMDRSAAKPSISENDKRKIHILVVEDNPVNQKVAQAMMRKMGLRADVVANGQEAVNALETIPYDLVFMDCHMPEMDGFEATRCIRQQGSKALNPHIPIVAMTASAMQGDRDKCIQAGMNDFIAKPVPIKELAEMLARWLAITTNDNLQSELGIK